MNPLNALRVGIALYKLSRIKKYVKDNCPTCPDCGNKVAFTYCTVCNKKYEPEKK